MKCTIVQAALEWENPTANLIYFEQKIAMLAGHTDLVILPEMFTTGFSMHAEKLAETMKGNTVMWLRHQAEKLNAVLVGSFICNENGQFFNRLIWMQPDGNFKYYDKRHRFRLAGEHEVFSSGHEKIVVEWRGLRFCPLICYDLRFPVWGRQTKNKPYDVLIYIANWPRPRTQHWQSLLSARAIENQAWCVGVNIVGIDGTGKEYSGDSMIVDFSGQKICQLAEQEGVYTVEISKKAIEDYRQRFPFLEDADAFTLLS